MGSLSRAGGGVTTRFLFSACNVSDSDSSRSRFDEAKVRGGADCELRSLAGWEEGEGGTAVWVDTVSSPDSNESMFSRLISTLGFDWMSVITSVSAVDGTKGPVDGVAACGPRLRIGADGSHDQMPSSLLDSPFINVSAEIPCCISSLVSENP